jgi:cobalt-zinc-cadmium efflux system outer membrane protein
LGLASLAWPAAAQTDSALTLSQALERATGFSGAEGTATANPRMVGPQEEALAAAALVDQARLRPNPEISLEVENVAGTGDYTGIRVAEYTLSAGLPIELGGKRRARINAAQAELNVADLRRQLAGADLGFMVRERYVVAVAANARIELAQGIYDRNRELLRIATALVDAGREPPLRSLRAQAEFAEAEAELKAAQAEALSARFALGAMWSQQGAPQVGTEFPDIQPPHELLADYSGLEPRLASAQHRAAEAAIGRERSLGVPDPTVSAGVRRFDETNDNAFLVGVTVPLPLWNRNSGNVAAAEARARAARAQEAVTLADYRQSVAEARADYLAAEARADTLETKSLPSAEEALRLAEIGYREGKFELIELLAAADARDATRRSLIDAREAQGRAAALLIRLAASDASAR